MTDRALFRSTSILTKLPARLKGLFGCAAWLMALQVACVASHHPTTPAELGESASSDRMIDMMSQPGPIEFEKILAANWEVPLSGLVNMDHPKARQAGLKDRAEPIELNVFVLRHPRFGTFLVDSGIETEFREPDSSPRLSWLVKAAMGIETLKVRRTTAEQMAREDAPIAGVFLTHIHLDHILGIPDVPSNVAIYTGPGETLASEFQNVFSSGTVDRLFDGKGPLREWRFDADPAGRFAGVIDVFGDGSFWALHVPGHSLGSTAFVVRTTDGLKMLLGDACHTAWGWKNGVEPGTFSKDQAKSVVSLEALLDLASRFPEMEVFPGHQSL